MLSYLLGRFSLCCVYEFSCAISACFCAMEVWWLDQFWIYLLHLTTTPFPAPCCLFWNWFQSYWTDHTQSVVVKAPCFLLFLWSIGCLKAQFQPLCHTMLMMYNVIIWPCFLASLHRHTANSRSCESLDIQEQKKKNHCSKLVTSSCLLLQIQIPDTLAVLRQTDNLKLDLHGLSGHVCMRICLFCT